MPPRRERPAPASRRGRDATARNHPATTTLTLGLTLHGVTSQPYLATWAATAGPDLVANVFPSRPSGGPPADLLALARAPGVTGHGGPYPVTLPAAAGPRPHGWGDRHRARPGTGPRRPAEGDPGQLDTRRRGSGRAQLRGRARDSRR